MWQIETHFAWQPIEVDVMDFNFNKIRTQKVWFIDYFIEVGEEQEKTLNNGKPYTLEFILNRGLFNFIYEYINKKLEGSNG
jgi:hypothetical protein